MSILQVKGIDDQLYEALKRRAVLDNRSVSQEVVVIIQEYLSKPIDKTARATQKFLELSDSWKGSESAEEVIQDIYSSRKQKRNVKGMDDVFN